MAEDLGSQLEIQNKINQAIQARSAILKENTNYLTAQTRIAKELCNALECKQLEGMEERLKSIRSGLKDAAKASEKNVNAQKDLEKEVQKAAKGFKKLNLTATAAGVAGANAAAALKESWKGALGMAKGFFTSIMNISQAVFGAMTKSYEGLVKKSIEYRNKMTEVNNAWEEVVSNVGRTSKEMPLAERTVARMSSGLAKMGQSSAMIFGKGTRGQAAMRQAMGAMIGELGDEYQKLAKDMSENAAQYYVFNKGLGVSGEALKKLSLTARGANQTLSDMLKTMTLQMAHMEKKFSVSVKRIGKNIDAMSKDFVMFGGKSSKAFIATATYAAKLGVEIAELQKITSKTDDFEGAADAAAQLGADFGMVVDTMELMTADPAQKMEMYRKAFAETGRSFADMSRQEKQRMMDITGATAEGLSKMFDPSMMNVSYDEIMKEADKAASGTDKQDSANKKLAKSLKLVYEQMNHLNGVTGFGGAFKKGMVDGIMNSKQMLAALRNIGASLDIVYKAGKKVGGMFVEMFPGVSQILKGIEQIFEPGRIKEFMDRVTADFKLFFEMLQGGKDADLAVNTFFDNISNSFNSVFGGKGKGGKNLTEGFTLFFDTVGNILLALAPILINKIAGVVEKLADFIGKDKENQTKLGAALSRMFTAVFKLKFAILKATISEIIPAIGGLLWEIVKHPMTWKVMLVWGAFMAAKMMMAIGIGAIKGAATQKAMAWLSAKFAKKTTEAVDGGTKQAQNIQQGTASTQAADGMVTALNRMTAGTIMKAMGVGLALVTFIGVSIVGLAYAFAKANDALKAVSLEDAKRTGLVIGGMAVAMYYVGKLISLFTGTTHSGSTTSFSDGSTMKSGASTSMPKVTGKTIVMVAATIGLMPVLAKLGVHMAGMIGKTPAVPKAKAITWGLTMTLIMGITAGVIGAAWLIGKLPLKQTAIGLGLIGGVTWALGKLGKNLVEDLVGITTTEGLKQVGVIMNALVDLLKVTATMMPVAASLGLIAMSFPFGTAGIAVLVAGYGVFGLLVDAMVSKMIPAIEKMGRAKIEKPKQIKLITDSIVDIMYAATSFMEQIQLIVTAAKPTKPNTPFKIGGIIDGLRNILDSLFANGIFKIIDKIMKIATSKDITDEGLKAVKAVTGIITAGAGLMIALQPKNLINTIKDMHKDDHETARWEKFFWTPGSFKKGTKATMRMIGILDKNAPKMSDALVKVTGALTHMLDKITPLLEKKDFTKSHHILTGISQVLQASVAMIGAFALNAKDVSAIKELNKNWDDTAINLFIKTMSNRQGSIGNQVVKIIGAAGEAISAVVTGMSPLMKEVRLLNLNPKILGPIFEGVSTMFKSMGSLIKLSLDMWEMIMKASTETRWLENLGALTGGTSTVYKEDKLFQNIKIMMSLMSGITEQFARSMPEIGRTVNLMLANIGSINMDPKKIKKLEGLERIMQVFETITSLFRPGGAFSGKLIKMETLSKSKMDELEKEAKAQSGRIAVTEEFFKENKVVEMVPRMTMLIRNFTWAFRLMFPEDGRGGITEMMTRLRDFEKKKGTYIRNPQAIIKQISIIKDFIPIIKLMNEAGKILMAPEFIREVTEADKKMYRLGAQASGPVGMHKMHQMGGVMVKHIGWIADAITDVAGDEMEAIKKLGSKAYDKDFVKPVLASVKALRTIVAANNDIAAIMSGIRPIDLQKTLRHVSEGLEIDEPDLKIAEKNLNLNINFKLDISAEEIAKSLIEANFVTPGASDPTQLISQ